MKKTALLATLVALVALTGCNDPNLTVTVDAVDVNGNLIGTFDVVQLARINAPGGAIVNICGPEPEGFGVNYDTGNKAMKTYEPEDLWYAVPGTILAGLLFIDWDDVWDSIFGDGQRECWHYPVTMPENASEVTVQFQTESEPFIFYLIGPGNGGEGEGEGEGETVNYVLTTSVQGQGSVTGAGTYPAGTTVHVTATPATGWEFDYWRVNGTRESNNPNAQVTMDSDVSLVGVFIQSGSEGEGEGEGEPPVNTYRLTTAIEGDGLIVANPIGPDYEVGTVVTLTAVAQNGSSFDRWSGDLSTSSNPVTITMSRDRSVTAWFSAPVVNDGPVINVQPHSITREVGDEARFEVQASGLDLHYQWRMNLVDLDPTECSGWSQGWNGPVLTIFHVGEINEGGYSCRVWNSHGTVETEVATLYVNDYGVSPTIWFEWNTAKTTPVCLVDFVGLSETDVASMFLGADGMTSINVSRLRQATALRVHHFREWAPPWSPVDDIVISGNWWNSVVEILLTNWNGNATGGDDNDRRIRTNLSLVYPDGTISYLDIEGVLFLLEDDTPINIERGAADFSMPAP